MAPESDRPTPYVFLSYASADRKQAIHIADLFEARGISVWLDRKSIAGGANWSAEIVRGIDGCAALAILCSSAGVASPNVQQEVQLAWEGRRPIVPLLLGPIQLPEPIRYALAGRQWVEVLDHPDDIWLAQLLRALAGLGIHSTVSTRTSSIGRLLKRFRLAAGLTQQQLADGAGLSARGISNIERGLGPSPHRDTLILLADALSLGPTERTSLDAVARGRAAKPAGFATVEQIASPLATPLVGRQAEWKRIMVVWEAAAASSPRLLVLAGEAGIGKTRLAEELLNWASDKAIVMAVARCYSAEGDLGYAPIISWLRAEAIHLGLERLDGEWLSELARLALDLVPNRSDVRQLGPMTEGWQRQRLFEALARAVIARSEPTLLLIDDLQWCPHDSLAWLHFLLRFNVQAPLLVVATVRVEEVHPDHPIIELLNNLRRESRLSEISVGPLTLEETTTLATYVAGHTLDEVQAARYYAETEGNPLFVVETAQVVSTATTRGAESADSQISVVTPSGNDLELPPGIRALVARRLSRVTPTASALLTAAAVVGRSFTSAVLARAAGVGEDELIDALDELGQRRIVRVHGPDAYDFTHDKLRVVAYAGLSPARRRLLHRRVAEALEAEHVADLDAVSGQLALHYERAGLPPQAAAFYWRSAASARQVYSNETAIANYRRALALTGALSPSDTALVHDQLGEVLHLVGHYDEEWVEVQSAIELTSPRERVTRGHLFRKLGTARSDQHRFEETFRAFDLAEDSLGRLDPTDSDAAWRCWLDIQHDRFAALYLFDRGSEALLLIENVRDAFEKHGTAAQRAELYHSSTLALLRRDRYRVSPVAMENVRAYRRAVEDADDVAAVLHARFILGFTLLWADELTEAEEELSAALALAERNGHVQRQLLSLTYLTVTARKQLNVELVRTRSQRCLAIGTSAQMPWYVAAALGNQAWTAWRVGDFAAARSLGQEAIDMWKPASIRYPLEWIGRWPLIGLALEQGEIVEAAAHARVLIDERMQRPPPSIEPLLEAVVRSADAGDFEKCREHFDEAVKAARHLGYL